MLCAPLRGLTICFAMLASSIAIAADVQLTVKASEPQHKVSPRLVGLFFEDINFGADGGLSAELVKNGAFEFPQSLMGWSEVAPDGASGTAESTHESPLATTSSNFLRIQSGGAGYGVANEGFRGMGVKAGEAYLFTAWTRSTAGEEVGAEVRLVGAEGQSLAEGDFTSAGSEWKKVQVRLTPSATDKRAHLQLTLAGRGLVDLDLVSLCPVDTWKGRPGGLRADVVQWLADVKPSFFRFPGGCIVEGSQLKYRYQWKTTIGDLMDRRLIVNRWNTEFRHRLTPDYYQSFAVGFYEYFQLAEDLGGEPLPILNCGMACQFNSAELVPLSELDPYIQDALDLIEFANGPVTSVWGAKRASMGHPEPFGMKLLGIGNEQWDEPYIERYEKFSEVLKAKHPEIEIVSGSGPFPDDPRFHYAWPELRRLKADIVDEHCYAMPDWFLRSAHRYDNYDRNGPEVFMGEYAAQSVGITSPDNQNNLRCALSEAAFLTGVERNSDIVTMSSYAPLFGHEDAWQWRPNLIWFDNLESYGTPNYYVQQLFSVHRGEKVLPAELTDSRPAATPSGRIGLATYRSSAEFKDVQVERNGEVVFSGDQVADAGDTMTFGGRWQVEEGVFQQSDRNAVGRMHFGDESWSDYTLSLKARKLGGREGFMVIFRNSSGGSYLQWNVGGWGNAQHGVQTNLASHSENTETLDQQPGSVESQRWYDVKVELQGDRVRCYLDDQLIHDLQIPGPNLTRLYASASRDDQRGQIIVKVVNPTDDATPVEVILAGVEEVGDAATAIVLSGAPDAVNSISDPDNVIPRNQQIDVAGPVFTHTFPAHSLTVLRIDAQ